MVAPVSHKEERGLTGRSRGRVTWLGRVVMQVEVNVDLIDPVPYSSGPKVLRSYTTWRDARREDVIEHKIMEGV